jgi:hypothetical protein
VVVTMIVVIDCGYCVLLSKLMEPSQLCWGSNAMLYTSFILVRASLDTGWAKVESNLIDSYQ